MLLSHHASTYEVMYQISALKLLAHLLFCVIYNQTDHVSLRSQFLCSLSLFAHSGVHHILCCDFFSSLYPMLPVSSSLYPMLPVFSSLYPMLPVSSSLYPMLPVSSSCVLYVAGFFVLCTLCCRFLWIVLFWFVPSVFSNVYFFSAINIQPLCIL
jgi:hypothetical protein